MKLNNLKWILILGISLRILLGSWLFHTDLKNIYIEAKFINSGWKQAYHEAVAAGRPIYYPPLVYTLIEANRKINGWMFSGYFDKWLADGSAEQTLKHPHLFRDLLAMKFPWLVADLAIAFLLYKLVEKEKSKKVLWLWLFNPLTQYGIYGFGNYDVLPALFMIWSIYFAKKGKWNLSYLSLGLAGGLKLFGILLLPVLFLIDQRETKKKLVGLGLSLLIFILSTLSAWLDPFVFKSVFLSNLSNTLFKTRIELSADFYLPIFLSFYFWFLLWLAKRRTENLVAGFLPVVGALLALSYFHPQWIIWVAPLLVLTAVGQKGNLLAYLSVVVGYFMTVFLIKDTFVTWGLLKGINNAFSSLNPLVLTMERIGLADQIGGVGRALFFAGIAGLSLSLFSPHNEEEKWEVPGPMMTLVALVLTLGAVFVLAHVVLTKNGRYIAVDRSVSNPKIALAAGTTIIQKFPTNLPNINTIGIRLKNVNLQTKERLYVSVANADKSEAMVLPIEGGSVGDDFNLMVAFAPIRDPKGELSFTLVMPEAKVGRELLVPYDENFGEGGLTVNEKPVKGSLSFTAYSNPGGIKENLSSTLTTMLSKW